MKTGTHVDKCLSFIRCDLGTQTDRLPMRGGSPPAITLSRQTGCGAAAVAGELAALLQAREGGESCPWTVFDKNLVERVLEEHQLPKEVAKFMPEDRVSAIQDAVEELLGLHPSTKTLLKQTDETIRRLARLGRVIVIGRGGSVITRDLPNVFHVRLVAPLEWRCQQVMARDGGDPKTVAEQLRKADVGRQRYLHDHLHTVIDDPVQYDLMINTSRIPHPAVAKLIAEAFLHWAHAPH